MDKKFIAAASAALISGIALAAPIELLNVSYDPTRELYRAYNEEFTRYWKDKTGQEVVVKQ